MNNNLIYDEYVGRIIEMQTDDGHISCSVILVFKLSEENNQKYIALAKIEDEELTDDLYVYRFDEIDNKPELSLIEADDEYDTVSSFLLSCLEEMHEHHHDHDHDGCGCECSGCGSHGCH